MNAASNVLRVLIILLIGVVILGVLLLAAMVIIPGMSLFGVKFVSFAGGSDPDKKQTIDVNTAEWQNASTLVVNTNGWAVEVRPFSNVGDGKYRVTESSTNLRVLFYSQYTGFIKAKEEGDEKASYSITYGTHLESGGGQACIITTKEPDAVWMARANAKVVVLYDNGVLDTKKVFINTDSGKIYLGSNILEGREQDKLKNVQITSKKGHITVGNIDVTESLDISKESGGLECKTNMTGNMKLSVSSGYGAIKVKNVGNPNAAENNISVNMNKIKNANMEFETIYGNLQYMEGTSGLLRGNKVTGSLIVNPTDACSVKIDEIEKDVIFNSKSGSLYVSRVGGKIDSDMTGGGQIHIKSLGGSSNIKAQGGKVALGENFKDSKSVAAGVGGDVNITSVGGDIYVKTSGQNLNYNIRSKNGSVELVDVNGTVDYAATDDGKSRIKMNYVALSGNNKITTFGGAVDLIIPTSVKALLTWDSEKETDIAVSGLLTKEKAGSQGINGGSLTATLNIHTKVGKITIKTK